MLLAVALYLPTVRFRTFGSEPEVYSIYGGIRSLWNDGNPILSSIVFAFSVVFPAVKLILLAGVWWRCGTGAFDRVVVRRLELLGKWSMLDIWIIALFVGSIRIGIATAESLVGIQVFFAAILVSMLATARMTTELDARPPLAKTPRLSGAIGRLVNLAAAVALAVALSSVLLTVKKAFIFSNDVGLWSTSVELFRGQERTLAVGLGLFVVTTSALRTLVTGWLRWAQCPSPRVARLALLLDEWAMIDVFALALAIVWVKLDQLATTEVGVGFRATIVAALFAEVDAWLVRRDLRAST